MWRPRARAVQAPVAALVAAVACGACGVTLAAGCAFFDVAAPAQAAEAGTDAATEDAGPPGFVALEVAVRACSKLVGCPPSVTSSVQSSLAISLDATNFTHCVDALGGPLDPDRQSESTSNRLACLAAAPTCTAAAACMLYRIEEPPDSRCSGVPEGAYCVEDGGAVLNCFSSASSTTVDCKNPAFPPGAHCKVLGPKSGFCIVDTPCPIPPECHGTVFDHCLTTAADHQMLDCAPSGQRCVPNVGCAGEQCIDISDTTCATATRMAVCSLTKVTPVDCAHIGAKCIKTNTTVACARDGDECSVFDEPRAERCTDATTIRLCVGGKPSSFSCASVGMKCASPEGLRSSYCAP